MLSANEKGILDYTGAAVSWACAAHCLMTPLLAVTVLPLAGLSFLAEEWLEWTFIALSIVVALLSFLPAYFRHHGKFRIALLFSLGLGLMIFSHAAFEREIIWKIPIVAVGAAFVTTAHLLNRRLCLARSV